MLIVDILPHSPLSHIEKNRKSFILSENEAKIKTATFQLPRTEPQNFDWGCNEKVSESE